MIDVADYHHDLILAEDELESPADGCCLHNPDRIPGGFQNPKDAALIEEQTNSVGRMDQR